MLLALVWKIFHTGIVALQILGTDFCKFVVAFHHGVDGPVQRTGCFLRIGNNRNQQMRKPIVDIQFDDFRVDHDHLNLIRICAIQNTHNDGIDTDGFTGTCCTCDEQMRHLLNISDNCLPSDIFAHCKSQFGF